MPEGSSIPSLDEAQAFHGHMCGGLAVGYRVAVEALNALGVERAEDEEMVAVVENDSCAVDAVQVVCGCTFGKGNLVFRDYGKRVYTFYSRTQGRGVRVVEHYGGYGDDAELRALRERVDAGDESQQTQQAIEARHRAHREAILTGPANAVLTIEPADAPPPPMARIEPSEPCEECGEATMVSRLVEVDGRRVCRACAGQEDK
jgi:formylmethanofuran dehydrogenase subunit E